MAYNKTLWSNDRPPAINAENLNKIENAIEEASNKIDRIGDLSQLKTENKDTLVNAINEGVVNYIDNQEVFTNEHLNGKKIYAKRIVVGSLTIGTNTKAHNVTNFDTMWIDLSNSFIKANSSKLCYSFNMVRYDNTSSSDRLQTFVNETSVNIISTGGWGKWTAYVTIKYTKN